MNTIIEKIRAEVNRQREEIRPTDTGEMKVVGTPTQLEQGWLNALSWMEKVLDTLQEQPVEIEKNVRISPGMISNFGSSSFVLDVELTEEERTKLNIVPGFGGGTVKIKILCE